METVKKEIFSNLFRRYYAPFCLLARQYIDETAVCEDIVSDVFSRLWDKSGDFILDEKQSVPYIRIAVKNSCLNYLKHESVKKGYRQEINVAIPSYAESADSVYTLDELHSLLRQAVSRMDDRQKTIFREIYIEGKKDSEMAASLGVSERTIERQRSIIRRLLQNEFKDYIPLLVFLSLIY
ncbi:MAG: sigma-70 family RNA polymerase sigma factor [Candidatus Cryptobacteroides sp.]